MKVVVDNILRVSEFGRRGGHRPDQVRYYYQVIGYDFLVLVVHGESYEEANGQLRVAFFDFDNVRGDIICREFPKAPARWQEESGATGLVQCSLRQVKNLPEGRPVYLNFAIRQHLGPPVGPPE